MATKQVNIDIIAKDKTRQAMRSATGAVDKLKGAVFNLRNAFIGLGAGLVTIGAANGIGKITSAAAEATGRQPEAAGDIRTTALIMSALIEGVALFCAVTCFLLQGKIG